MAVLRMHAVRLQLASIASQVIEDLRPIAARRGQGIECRLAAAPIDGLEFAVGVLLRNLIDNAMRYGPDSGTVRVSTASEPSGAVLLQVEDSGPGIAPADHERVFQRFQRLASDEEGCGIGLSIVRAVVDLHRAGVELGRSDLGGLRVTVRFPAPSAELGHAGIRAPAGQEPAAA
jgi:signal transduction histidine kinase